MEIIDYILLNAKEIMFLCFGVGFFSLVIALIRPIIIATRLLRKVDAAVNFIEHYIQKPVQMIMDFNKFLSRFL